MKEPLFLILFLIFSTKSPTVRLIPIGSGTYHLILSITVTPGHSETLRNTVASP